MAAKYSAFLPYPATVLSAPMARLRRTVNGVQGSLRTNLQVWGLVFVVILASLTQAGVPLALHGAGASGPGAFRAASNIIYICTGSGIQPVRLGAVNADIRSAPDGATSLANEADKVDNARSGGKTAPSHAFCAHCAFCHAIPVLAAGFVYSHPALQSRFSAVLAGQDARFIMAAIGFAPRGPPVSI
ncbi:hypothetical protein [Thalassospira mesophila]|uniref:DUF2946 domain-containing protein n=1 Tax=Thalassospira mesophila TaxID=1293891 RepID=A0A1Y2L503_9PROT|nr:hypothetical protein [Thalassospira mesophila]OSQ39613.1 hypothetical protein TMES_06335 [Thalassospira mesophila]